MSVDDKYTVSLLHFEGDFNDESGKVWSIDNYGDSSNTAVISSTQSKFGGSSLKINEYGALYTPASTDFYFASGDFTIDWWEYRTQGSSSGPTCFSIGNAAHDASYMELLVFDNSYY